VIFVSETGVLVIAHGSKNQQWVQRIDEAVANANVELPVTVGFLELVEGRSIADGVRELENKKVKRILAIPLFVSSASTHLEEIRYALGVIPQSRIETDLELVHPQAEIIWCSAMDGHPLMLKILTERIGNISMFPSEETLLLVGHGSDIPEFHEMWEQMLGNLAKVMRSRLGFKESSYGTLHPDNLAERAAQIAQNQKVIVVPVFLSPGYLTSEAIPSRLDGTSFIYNGETYLPHPLVSQWIKEQVEIHLAEPLLID
jgi:sirohydrochlorin cobaltochelatase